MLKGEGNIVASTAPSINVYTVGQLKLLNQCCPADCSVLKGEGNIVASTAPSINVYTVTQLKIIKPMLHN